MNEFEWRRQMRELRQPQTPRARPVGRDRRGTGRCRHGSAPLRHAARRRHWLLAGGMAASLLLAGGIGWHRLQTPALTPVANQMKSPTSWKPSDPRLAGAAVELDAARMELQLAIRQAPDSPALQRLLDRTELQQSQLRQLAHQAG